MSHRSHVASRVVRQLDSSIGWRTQVMHLQYAHGPCGASRTLLVSLRGVTPTCSPTSHYEPTAPYLQRYGVSALVEVAASPVGSPEVLTDRSQSHRHLWHISHLYPSISGGKAQHLRAMAITQPSSSRGWGGLGNLGRPTISPHIRGSVC